MSFTNAGVPAPMPTQGTDGTPMQKAQMPKKGRKFGTALLADAMRKKKVGMAQP